MEQSGLIKTSKKINFRYEKYFRKYIFDEDFLDEKDKALSPMVLSDVIPGETKKSLKEEKGISFKATLEKDIKYGSNIIYISSKMDDNDEERRTIMNEQINKIIIDQVCKKYSSVKKAKKKKKF